MNFRTEYCMSLTLTVALFAAGCARTRSSRFYLLTAEAAHIDTGTTAEKNDSHAPVICVRPVQIPQYLDRPQIVTRLGDQQVHLADFDRWAERLESNTTRVLADDLASLMPGYRVAVFPRPGGDPADHEVRVLIKQFDGEPGKDVLLKADWSVSTPGAGSACCVERAARYTATTDASDYDALVDAMSRLLLELSRDISESIKWEN